MRAFLCALVLLLSAPAFAEKWALLIGINDYEDRNYIASLGAADNDARKLKEVLKSKMGFPEANIELLVSDGDNKPTRSNIIVALGKLAENAKAGDTVFVFYSGHGTEINGTTYLLPHDFKGRNQFTGTETALAISKFQELLKQVKTSALIMAWDMCRNDPFAKGKSGDAARAKLADTKAWQIVSDKARSLDSPVMVTLFACAPGQSSYEWQEKNRGYFAWFLEEGMKGAAADATGNVTLGSLAKYVRTKVMEQTKISEPAVQSPTSSMDGASPEEFVLLRTSKPVAGNTPPSTGNLKPIATRSTINFKDAPEKAEIKVGKTLVKGFTWSTDLLEPTHEVTVTITAPGYRPQQFKVTMKQGDTLNVNITLEKDTTTETGPAPDPGGNVKVPPPQTEVSGALGAVMEKIRQAHNWSALSAMRAFKIDGSGLASLGGNTSSLKGYNLIQHPDGRFRVVYSDDQNVPTNAGFNGTNSWRTVGNKRSDPQPVDRFGENPIAPLIYFLANPPQLSERFSKLNNSTPYLQGKDVLFGDIKIFFNPKTYQITKIDVKVNGAVLTCVYNSYTSMSGIPIPNKITVEAAPAGIKIGEIVYTFPRIEPNAALGTDYYLNGR